MPRDKTATHAKLVPIVKEEFLIYGYEKASINRIAAAAGISPAGLYRHYDGKEAMFASLVEDTLADFDAFFQEAQNAALTNFEARDPFTDDWLDTLLDFIYDHYDGFKLLICRAAGSRYESFEEDMIAREAASSKQFSEKLAPAAPVSDEQWQIVASIYVHAVADMIRLDLPRAAARERLRFLGSFLFPGWKVLLGAE